MNKRKKKILSVVAVVALVATVFGIIGTALTIDDGMFSNNTPMKITPNAEVIGSIDVKGDHEEYMFEVTQNGILTVRLDHDNLLDSLKCGCIIVSIANSFVGYYLNCNKMMPLSRTVSLYCIRCEYITVRNKDRKSSEIINMVINCGNAKRSHRGYDH